MKTNLLVIVQLQHLSTKLIIQIELGKIKLVLEQQSSWDDTLFTLYYLLTIGTLAIHQVFGTVAGDCIIFNINNIDYCSALNSIFRSVLKIIFFAGYRSSTSTEHRVQPGRRNFSQVAEILF